MELSIEKAKGLFGINTVTDKDSLKKLYRKLMKENHPDAGGSAEISAQLNKAYEMLNTAFDNGYFDTKADIITRNRPDIDMSGFVAKEIPLVRLNFAQLDSILNKESVTIMLDGKPVEISKGMLDRCKILIMDYINIKLTSGKINKYRISTSYKMGSRELNCNGVIENLLELGNNLEISLGNKTIKVGTLSANSSLSYKFDNYSVNINIVR